MPATSWISINETTFNSGVTTPDNAWTSDDLYAQWTNLNQQVYYSDSGNWNFGIPSTATITGIEVRIEGKYTGSGINRILGVEVTYDGGTNWSSTRDFEPTSTSDADYTLGSSSDLWGTSPSVSDIEDNGSLYIKLRSDSLSVTSIDVDHVEMRIHYAFTKTHTTDALIQDAFESSHTTNSYLQTSSTPSHTTDAYLELVVSQPTWVSPADTASVTTASEPLVFTIPTSDHKVHFELEIDTANTFDTVDLITKQTWQDQANWEYHNGSTWVAFPADGVDASVYAGNNARYTPTSLSQGTYYRRIRGRATVEA